MKDQATLKTSSDKEYLELMVRYIVKEFTKGKYKL